ncbi:MAG: lysylphosphatidylglycerol synthase transmembrane domain-containing protein [Solirubrobacteraceae bacterium]
MAVLHAEAVQADGGLMRSRARARRRRAEAAKPSSAPAGLVREEGLRAEPPRAGSEREEMPRLGMTRRRMLGLAAFVLVALAFLYVVLPQLGGVKHTWDRLGEGDASWIAVALVVQVVSMASYIAIFQGVHVPPGSPIRWRHSYQITMAGLAATRLFAAGGAGGVAITAWSLRRSGMEGREVAQRMIAFLVLLYGVYMVALVVCGVGLYTGLFPGPHPFAITIVPAIVGAVGIAVFLAIAFVPDDLERRLGWVSSDRRSEAARPGVARQTLGGRPARLLERLASGPASISSGVRFAFEKLRHPDLAMIGVVTWWGFNIAVLYASFRAFGQAPPVAVLVQAYFVGMLANLLPLPGGIGVVDGGMIGAFVAFGVSPSLAVPAVLMYRLFAFWLPSIPGAIAYFQLRRTVSRWGAGGEPEGRIGPETASVR